jgi:hypothetical protein
MNTILLTVKILAMLMYIHTQTYTRDGASDPKIDFVSHDPNILS